MDVVVEHCGLVVADAVDVDDDDDDDEENKETTRYKKAEKEDDYGFEEEKENEDEGDDYDDDAVMMRNVNIGSICLKETLDRCFGGKHPTNLKRQIQISGTRAKSHFHVLGYPGYY